MTIVVLIRPPCILLRPKAPLRRLNWIQTNDKTETSAKQQIHKPSIFFKINFLFLFLIIIHKCWEFKKQDRQSPIYIYHHRGLYFHNNVCSMSRELKICQQRPLFHQHTIFHIWDCQFDIFLFVHLPAHENTPKHASSNIFQFIFSPCFDEIPKV